MVGFVSEMSTRAQRALRGERAVLNDQTFLNHRLVVAQGAGRLRWGLLNQTRFLTRCTFGQPPAPDRPWDRRVKAHAWTKHDAATEGVLVHAACTPPGRHFEKYDFFRGVLALRSAAARGSGGGGGGGGRADGISGGGGRSGEAADGGSDYADDSGGGSGGGGGGELPWRSAERCVALHLGNLRGDLPPRATPGPCSSSGQAAAQVRPERTPNPNSTPDPTP